MQWFDDTETWGMALGFFTPLAVAVVQQPSWSPRMRWVVGWACALVVGVLTCLANGTLDEGGTVARTLILVLVTSQAAYAGWKRGPAPAIEKATSGSSGPGEGWRSRGLDL